MDGLIAFLPSMSGKSAASDVGLCAEVCMGYM